MTHDELIAALEAASGPSRELDSQIADHIGIRHRPRRTRNGVSKGREWFVDSHGGIETWSQHPPAFTASIDAALTLVPEGWRMTIEDWTCDGAPDGGGAKLVEALPAGRCIPTYGYIWAATPALALCIAALKARQ